MQELQGLSGGMKLEEAAEKQHKWEDLRDKRADEDIAANAVV